MLILTQSRDTKLLEGIEKHKYLRTDQAAELFFKDIKNKQQRARKAATRLLNLYKGKMVKRFRFPGTSFIYTTSGTRYSTKMIHYFSITDVLIEIFTKLPSQTHTDYEIEFRQENVITDLYLTYNNEFRKLSGELYIEVELENSTDILEKIAKYEILLADQDNTQLIIVCKHKRVLDRIKAHEFDIPVKAIDLRFIGEQFKL